MSRADLDLLAPIVSAGEALVDLIVAPGASPITRVGGAPLNAARTMARLGAPTIFVGGVSKDPFGTLITEELDRCGIRGVPGQLVDLPTPIAVAGLDSAGSASYWFHLEHTSAFALGPLQARQALAEPLSALIVGSLGLVMNPMADALAEAIDNDAALGDVDGAPGLVMVDLNCRSRAISDPSDYLARVKRVLARSDVVKASTEDLGYLHSGRSALDAAKDLLDHGPKVVLVTDGGHAVRVVSAKATLGVAVKPVEVIDTVGAGDAFSGGFLTWWVGRGHRRADLAEPDLVGEAVLAACDVAAITCSRVGADPPWAAEIASAPRWRWLRDLAR